MLKWVKKEDEGEQLDRPNPLITDKVRILSVTWNIGGKTPALEHLADLIHPREVHHDLYIIAT